MHGDGDGGSEFDIVSAPEGSRWQAICRRWKRAGIAGLDATWISVQTVFSSGLCGSFAYVEACDLCKTLESLTIGFARNGGSTGSSPISAPSTTYCSTWIFSAVFRPEPR